MYHHIASNAVKKVLLVVIMLLLLQHITVQAQQVNAFGQKYNLSSFTPPPVPDPVCAYCNYKLPNHAANCPYNSKNQAAKKTTSSSLPGVMPLTNQNLSLMVAGTIMQSFFNGLMASNAQQKQQQQLAEQQQQMQLQMQMALQKKIKDSIDNLNYLKLKSSYKQLQGAQELSLKAASVEPQLDFKKLDGDDETMRANAGKAFDGNTISDTTGGVQFFQGTNFFGSDISKTLIHPEKDSVMMDIHNTDKYLKEHEIADSAKVANLKNENKNQQQVKKNIDCPVLQRKLNDYLSQRNKFHRTIESTQTDLEDWQKRNSDALLNAALSGLDFAFGKVFDRVETKGAEAEKFRERFKLNMDKLRAKGVDVDNFLKTLDARIFNKNILLKGADEFKDAAEYDAFVRDELQVQAKKLAATDSAYSAILKDTAVQMLLNDNDPSLDASQFIANKAAEIGIEKVLKSQFLRKLVLFDNKIPYIKYAQIAVDEAYNAYDWYLSYQRIKDLHETSGKELQAAAGLQMLIDKTIEEVRGCPVE